MDLPDRVWRMGRQGGSRKASQETIKIVQVRDSCGLDQWASWEVMELQEVV